MIEPTLNSPTGVPTRNTPPDAAVLNAPHGADAIEHLPMERINPPEPFFRGFFKAVREVWAYRELLGSLIRKELKVKYKDSFLGFLWSLARPILMLAIYYVAIGKFLGASIPNFVIYLFIGLIAWGLFTDVLGACTGSIIGNAGLIKKVYFPRELLPLSAVGAAFVHFCIQMFVLMAAMLVLRFDFFGWNLLLIFPSLLVLLLLAIGSGLILAGANVYLRDVQHLLEMVLLFLFWMSPVVYPVTFVAHRLRASFVRLYLANPLTNVVIGFQRALYKHVRVNGSLVLYDGNILARLGLLIVISAAYLWLAQRIFARAQGNFAQVL